MDNSNQSDSENQQDHFTEEIEEKIYKFNGEEIVKKYVKGKFLGKGGFAKCYELKCLNNKKIYAAKIVSKQNLSKQTAKQKLKSEIKIHKSLFHANIVKFEHVFEDNQNVYILLELCKNKTLNELIKKRKILTEIEVKYYLDQILKAVKFMHKNKIIHRDLKLGNLFINENMEIKIGDFGLATQIQYDGERKHTICGTPNYIAPEILEGKSTGHSYEVDYWAIGVIIYTLLLGRPPFETEDVKETYKRIHNNNYSFPNHIFISEDARDLIRNILVTTPTDRLNLDAMRNHNFMSKTNIPKTIPQYSINYPPNFQFYRKYMLENKQISSVNDLSKLNDSTDYDKYLAELREFAQKNVKEIKSNVAEINLCDENIIPVKQREKNNNLNKINNSANLNDVKQFHIKNNNMNNATNLNNSMSKENHLLLKNKKTNISLALINYVENIVDYSSSFGIMYLMNNNVVGISFNDKTSIHKFLNTDEFYYESKKTNYKKAFSSKNLKDVPSEIRMKLSLLGNYEKYLINHSSNGTKYDANSLNTFSKEHTNLDIDLNKNTNKRNIYVRKIIKTDISYIFKLSNNVIQLIFSDNSKIVIDNYETRCAIFFDKNKKIYNYNIHLVNKCNNKRFLKRYEHYKKVFYEKMEERFMKNHKNSDAEEIEQNVVDNFESKPDLNKTT